MTRKILGLDIQDNAVSAILLGIGIKGTTIEAHDYVPFAKESADGSGLASALEVITQKIDIAGTSCVVSLPANLIFCRNLKIPFKGKKKIAKILPYEIEPTLPLPIDDLIIDFDVIKRVEYTEHTDIIAAAMETSNLQSYLDTLSKFHIDPEVVTFSGYSTALCINNLIDENKKWLLLDIGDTQVTMFIGFAGDIRLLRSFSIPEDDTPDAGERFCTGIHQTISAFEDTFDQNFQPDQIFFTGSRRDAPVFEGQLATILETPIKRMDLVRDTESIKVFSAEPSWSSRRTDGAFALALMGIQGSNGLNFRKGPFAAKNFWQEHKKNLIKTGLLVTVVAVLALSNLVLDSYLMKQKIHRLDDQIAEIMTSTFPDVKKIVDPLQQMRTKMQQLSGNAFLPKETHRAIPTVDILRDISRLVPKTADVNLTRMVIDTDSVVISGTTDTYKSVDIIKNSLEQVEFFRKIVISSANIDKSDNRVQFKLKIDF
jgi:type II secretory pathway component PulL